MKVKMSLSLLLLIIGFVFFVGAAEWNTMDYMKREHSLIRPYQGTNKN